MAGFLIIAHAPLASSLKAVAEHVFPERAHLIQVLDVTPAMAPELIEALALPLLALARQPDVLILTDVFGASPCNAAQRLAAGSDASQVKVVCGVNVPMVWRAIAYASEPLDLLAARAVTGATQGVMQVAVSKPQNQANKVSAHDSNHAHHQQ